MIIAVLILLGLFTVYVINAGKTKTATREALLSLPSANPSPSPTQTLNIKTDQASNSSTSKAESETAIIKTAKGDIEIAFYSKEAPKTVQNFVQ